jgi:hypothetical protein
MGFAYSTRMLNLAVTFRKPLQAAAGFAAYGSTGFDASAIPQADFLQSGSARAHISADAI